MPTTPEPYPDEAAAQAPANDQTAYVEVFARLLCAADVHPTWKHLDSESGRRIRDDYRKAARWLASRLTAPSPTQTAPAGQTPATDQAAEIERLRGTVERARTARRRLTSALTAVESHLTTPYPDDPRWTPWTRFVQPALKGLTDALRAEPDAAELRHLVDETQPTEAASECPCVRRSPDDYDGPVEDCPEHGNPLVLGYCPLGQYEAWRKENDRLRAERDEARTQCTEQEQQHQFAMEEATGRLAQADKAYVELLEERNRLRAELAALREATRAQQDGERP
jgi:hypothetical protein